MARFFINRPIVAIVISIITVVGGLLAMRSLPVAQYPSIIPPQIIVSTTFTGADAVTVEQSVATPLEQQMNGVDDMLYMQSTNANDGTMALTVTFDIDTDPNIDQVNVSNRVAQAGKEMTYTARAQGRLQSAEEFAQIVVRSNPDGSVVRLTDVARIELGALNYQQVSRVNGQPGSIVAVFQAPGSNALDVARGVKDMMAELKQRFPPDLDYLVTLDTTLPVTEGIREISKTILEAMLLVTLVVFMFLQNWRATLIPIIAVPVSLIGSFAVFPLLGFSISAVSLCWLVLVIGSFVA